MKFLLDYRAAVLLFEQIKRSVLALVEDTSQVFTDYSEKENLHAANEKYGTNERGIPRYIAAINQSVDEYE